MSEHQTITKKGYLAIVRTGSEEEFMDALMTLEDEAYVPVQGNPAWDFKDGQWFAVYLCPSLVEQATTHEEIQREALELETVANEPEDGVDSPIERARKQAAEWDHMSYI